MLIYQKGVLAFENELRRGRFTQCESLYGQPSDQTAQTFHYLIGPHGYRLSKRLSPPEPEPRKVREGEFTAEYVGKQGVRTQT